MELSYCYPTGFKGKPTTETEPPMDGSGNSYSNITQAGVTYTSMLVAASGLKKDECTSLAGPDYRNKSNFPE
jgi:hypothetical protein